MLKQVEEEHENSERWLLTYSDLITLLMIFFVIMFATSNVDAKKFKEISDSFNGAFGEGTAIIASSSGSSIENSNLVVNDTDKNDSIESKLEEYLEESNISNGVTVDKDDRGVRLSIQDTLSFDLGEDTIKEEFKSHIIDIGNIISQFDKKVYVEGHTDTTPIHNDKFSSNWQLSSGRASNVAELLSNNTTIPKSNIVAVGYGEYRPVYDNSTEEGRARNRRVDIIISED